MIGEGYMMSKKRNLDRKERDTEREGLYRSGSSGPSHPFSTHDGVHESTKSFVNTKAVPPGEAAPGIKEEGLLPEEQEALEHSVHKHRRAYSLLASD